jgi:hypothetical protein
MDAVIKALNIGRSMLLLRSRASPGEGKGARKFGLTLACRNLLP